MPRGRRVTLTFDNGPTPGVTDQVLDILAERSLRAIFFVVAGRVAGDAAARVLLTRMVGDCHRVGNHSLTHGRPLGELREQQTIAEIATAHDILREFTGENFLFRPWGTEGQLDRRCLNRTAVNYLVSGKHTCVLWNSVPRDWADPVGWIDRASPMSARENTPWWSFTTCRPGPWTDYHAFSTNLTARGGSDCRTAHRVRADRRRPHR